MATCTMESCAEKRKAHGLCMKHYARLRKHGDPSITLKVVPETGATRRFIEEAKAADPDTCLFWPFHRNNDGYACVWHNGQKRRVHDILCTAIHGPKPPCHEVAHECGRGADGCVNPHHLSWKTHAENMRDRARHNAIRGAA